MINAYLKNNEGQNVFPKSKAENIFDKNGINLESHLALLYNEISKRDIKRCYLELSEITDKPTPTTYEILSAMADNTIAMLAIENDSYLISEIGSRLGGVLILVKKTSVYFSSGVFFTYRYGEVYTGVSGVGGTSFNWNSNTKTIHSLHSGTATQIRAVNSYQKLGDWGGLSVNPRLTEVNGVVTIPKDISHIMISAYVVLESVEEGDKFLRLFKNGAETNIMVKATGNKNMTLALTPLIIEVAENDELDLRVYSNSRDTMRYKHFTIEVID